MDCERACHFDHLPDPLNSDETGRIKVYTEGFWRCNECRLYQENSVDVILGWRKTGSDTTVPDFSREYLVKFEDESYARALWVPGTWLSGVSFAKKSNFDAKETPTIESSKDVIPDAWLRPDIVFDVQYDNVSREGMKFRTQSNELDAISKVTSALCKWQKLKYEESKYPFHSLC
jgi:hypothetical protein